MMVRTDLIVARSRVTEIRNIFCACIVREEKDFGARGGAEEGGIEGRAWDAVSGGWHIRCHLPKITSLD
jgi:hypothetical protein